MENGIPWGSLHTHSKFSAKDALDSVPWMVAAAQLKGYGALGLTDHGNVAGIHELYRSCKGTDVLPVPGIEMYVAFDRYEKRPVTWHMGLLAVNNTGWNNLIGLSNHAHRNFKYKPIIDLGDLQEFSVKGMLNGLWATTGCFFGIVETMLRTGTDPAASLALAMNMVNLLRNAFGDRVLVELQNHEIDNEEHTDAGLIEVMGSIADTMAMQTVITTDSHYAMVESVHAHKTLKTLSSWSPNPDEAVFPGDGYWLMGARALSMRFDPDVWKKGIEGFERLMADYSLTVPELDTFTLKVPQLVSVKGSPEEVLRQRVMEHMDPNDKKVAKRVATELDVICGAGFAPYILLTAEVTDYCRAHNIRYITRGSAGGSYVCYLMRITQVNPLRHKTLFERFLTMDRTKPPDIDLDVQHDRRQEVLDHLRETYAVCHIGTWRVLSNDRDSFEDKGSLFVKWKMMARKMGQSMVPTDSVRRSLDELAEHEPYDGIGMHAAGILVVQDNAVLERIPQQWIASSKTMVTSLDKDMIESLGYVKLDVLGLKTLTAVVQMERTTGIRMEEIEPGDPDVFAMLTKGRTEGVFQLSGIAQRLGLIRLRPKKFEDIVVSLALFRPAVMQSGAMDAYLNARRGAKREKRHALIERHVSSTHGVILFQEQVVSILRDLGMSPEELNIVLKAVKASNADIGNAADNMRKVRLKVLPLASVKGFSEEDVAWLENAMQAYSMYGFNRAHAVSYAFMAYRTAWFKYHHPVDYWAAMLSVYRGDKHKEADYRKAMREEGHIVLPAHVNKSKAGYSIDPVHSKVRAGLDSVDGVGEKAAAAIVAAAPYKSMQDFAERNTSRAVSGTKNLRMGHSPESCGGVVAALHAKGALRGLPFNEQERLL